MSCCKIRLFPVATAIAAAMVWSAAAQQPIIFSKPADASGTAKPDASLAPETKHETHGLFNIPMSIFEPSHSAPGVASFSGGRPAPTVSPEQLKAWQKELERKQHWTLMTEREILGIPTPEKILGLPAKDGEGNLTFEERYVKRHEKMTASLLEVLPSATKPPSRSDAPMSISESPFAHKIFDSVFAPAEGKSSAAPAAGGTGVRNGSIFSTMLGGTFNSAVKPEAHWGNTFNFPVEPPKAKPGQLAGMDKFRESLQPSAVFQKAMEPKRLATVTARDPFMNVDQAFNARGSSFAPLKNNTTRPFGLNPLPGIVTRPLPPPTVRSPWQPELPPWLREDADKPSGTPQRRF